MIPAPLLDLPHRQAKVFADFDFRRIIPYRAYFELSEEILDLVRVLLVLAALAILQVVEVFLFDSESSHLKVHLGFSTKQFPLHLLLLSALII